MKLMDEKVWTTVFPKATPESLPKNLKSAQDNFIFIVMKIGQMGLEAELPRFSVKVCFFP